MKKALFSLVCLLMLGFAAVAQHADAAKTNATATAKADGPVLTFAEKSHDFGDIKQGEKVSYTFKFKNTGNAPLIISNVQTTCGCTVSNWTKEPVAPGKSGEVSATFNSAGKMAKQNKVITVYSNSANGVETVSIVSNVLQADASAQ